MDYDSFQILGLAGSLRRASFNRGLIRSAKNLVPRGVSVESYEQLEKIPFFNRDVEDEGDPTPVVEFEEDS